MKYLLPGMGASSAMYKGPWESLPDALAIDWPELDGKKTIEKVAIRMIDEYGIGDADTIIGSSLGGIVALEIHYRVNLRQVILIGSAVTIEEINPYLIAMAPLARITPISFFQYFAGNGSNEIISMFAQADADFIRDMSIDLAKWNGYHGSLKAVKRIHGENDEVIRCPNDAYAIAGGGHLIAMTHAEECVRIIKEICC